jgi:hypothetical protein
MPAVRPTETGQKELDFARSILNIFGAVMKILAAGLCAFLLATPTSGQAAADEPEGAPTKIKARKAGSRLSSLPPESTCKIFERSAFGCGTDTQG